MGPGEVAATLFGVFGVLVLFMVLVRIAERRWDAHESATS